MSLQLRGDNGTLPSEGDVGGQNDRPRDCSRGAEGY